MVPMLRLLTSVTCPKEIVWVDNSEDVSFGKCTESEDELILQRQYRLKRKLLAGAVEEVLWI
jgi:hypothetical protein